MLRYLVWRLLFEACNIKRLFGHGSERVNYLAFGANLSDAIMAERRIRPFAADYFTLRDYALRFDHPAAWAGCGYASAEYAPGEELHGIVYQISGRDAARMDFYEAVPVIRRYRRTWVEQDGQRVFFYQTNRSTPGLKPTRQYLGYIVDGLRAHPGVGADYFSAMESMETNEPGAYVASYLWEQPPGRARWLRRLVEIYQRASAFLFLNLIYRFSPTAPLIRWRDRSNG